MIKEAAFAIHDGRSCIAYLLYKLPLKFQFHVLLPSQGRMVALDLLHAVMIASPVLSPTLMEEPSSAILPRSTSLLPYHAV